MDNSNPYLEKHGLVRDYYLGKNQLSSEDLGRKINEIDYHARSKDSKLLENIFRKGGNAVMFAGLLGFIGCASFMNYQAYRGLSDPTYAMSHKKDSQNKWLVGSFMVTYCGSLIYALRRKEWDQFEKNSK